jgi:hypothetical protein
VKRILAVLAVLLTALPVSAETLQRSCGTPELDMDTVRWIEGMSRKIPAERLAEEVQIPIVLHLIQAGKKGRVSDNQIQTLVHNLNVAFSGTPFSFHLVAVNRVNNKAWYNNCSFGSKNEKKMKQRLAWDPRSFVNVYTCQTNTPQDGVVGYATFPFWYAENSFMHGIALHPLSMPGSGNPEIGVYGLTLAHEMGHYLGAYHTFQGGCADGDEVADTPAQAQPTMTCSPGADTCAGGGADDVFNFMNYTPDTCMDHFTAGQVQRMIGLTSAFRPNLVF